MPSLTAVRRAEVADVLARRGASIVRDTEAGLSYEEIGRRLGINRKMIATFVSQERKRRHEAKEARLPETRQFAEAPGVGGGGVALLSDGLLDDLAAAVSLEGTSQPPRPRQTWERTPDGKPGNGDDRLPGFAAWELVHGAGMSVKDVQRKLGLRYPSEVYELLAAHKRGLEGIRAEAAAANRTNPRPRVPCV